jgi:hypothetical protein
MDMTTIHGTAELVGGPLCGAERAIVLDNGRPPIEIFVGSTRYQLRAKVDHRALYWRYIAQHGMARA